MSNQEKQQSPTNVNIEVTIGFTILMENMPSNTPLEEIEMDVSAVVHGLLQRHFTGIGYRSVKAEVVEPPTPN